jgi:LmbE family N-acetylglucosaminyl deacetylase
VKILAITAHYDDLEICAGGTAALNDTTSVVLYPRILKGDRGEALKAYEYLGVKEQTLMGADRVIVADLTDIAEDYDLIVTNHKWDSHPDHQKAASIAEQVARKNQTGLWYMDHAIPGGHPAGPRPNTFVNTSAYDMVKYDAIECYNCISQDDLAAVMRRDRYYGAIHGLHAAEGFIQQHMLHK